MSNITQHTEKWSEFYKGLLSKADTKDGMCHLNTDDIRDVFKDNGYHEYCFGGFKFVYTSKPLSDEEKERYEAETQAELNEGAEQIAKWIDKEILKGLKKQGKI